MQVGCSYVIVKQVFDWFKPHNNIQSDLHLSAACLLIMKVRLFAGRISTNARPDELKFNVVHRNSCAKLLTFGSMKKAWIGCDIY